MNEKLIETTNSNENYGTTKPQYKYNVSKNLIIG